MKVNDNGNVEFIDFGAAEENAKLNVNYEYVLPYFL